MAIAFGAPKSEKGYIALGITFIFIGSLFLAMMFWIWIVQPQLDILASSLVLLIFASIFIILGIIFIAKRKTLLERRLAKADRFF